MRFLGENVCRKAFAALTGIGESQLLRTSEAWRAGNVSYTGREQAMSRASVKMAELQAAILAVAKGPPVGSGQAV